MANISKIFENSKWGAMQQNLDGGCARNIYIFIATVSLAITNFRPIYCAQAKSKFSHSRESTVIHVSPISSVVANSASYVDPTATYIDRSGDAYIIENDCSDSHLRKAICGIICASVTIGSGIALLWKFT